MRTFKRSVVLAAALVGVFAGSARAQEVLLAKVPFPFVVHGEQFPAGSYDLLNAQGLITIRGRDNRAAIFALATPADGQDPTGDRPSLVFIHNEREYRLSQIWESGREGLALSEHSIGRRRERAQSSSSEPPTVVVAVTAARAGSA